MRRYNENKEEPDNTKVSSEVERIFQEATLYMDLSKNT